MATATAVGGKGGDSSDPAGNGGNANATANATAGGVAAEATATATGGAGGAATVGAPGIGGDATATANAVSLMDGAGVTATAHSPGGGPASAMSVAAIGPGAPPPVEISTGQSASVAILTPGEAKGEMSAGYGGEGETLVYETTADFNFTIAQSEPFYLTLLGSDATGNGFDSLELTVATSANTPPLDYMFASLRSAEMFFLDHTIDLGFEGAGPQMVDISLFLTASGPGDGFGFSYTVTVPEAPTWAMVLAGFAGLGLAAIARGRRVAGVAWRPSPLSAAHPRR
jgi:hypothetical protein